MKHYRITEFFPVLYPVYPPGPRHMENIHIHIELHTHLYEDEGLRSTFDQNIVPQKTL